jgi:hypothetical protein
LWNNMPHKLKRWTDWKSILSEHGTKTMNLR